MPPKQYLAAQEQHFIRYLREQVYPFSPFYRELLDYQRIKPGVIRSIKDISCIPFTTKADIAPLPEDPEIPYSLVLQPEKEGKPVGNFPARAKRWWLRRTHGKKGYRRLLDDEYLPVHMHFTVGRTALPTPILYTAYDLGRTREAGRRIFELLEITREDVLINAFPFAPHLAFWMTYFAAEATGVPALHTGGGRILGTRRILDAVERFRGTVLTATPSYAYHLLREAASQGRDFSSLRTLVMGGDRLPEGLKEKMLDLLKRLGAEDAVVAATYGFTEGKVAWSECRPSARSREESSGYHLFPDMEIIEIVDPETGERVEEGEGGEVVYTSLDWRGSVLLRFRTGDLVERGITYEPCPYCGRTVPRLGPKIKRSSEYKEFEITKLKGTLVDLNAFYPLLSGHKNVLEWQLEIRKHNDDPFDLDELHLFITPSEGVSRKHLERELRELLQKEVEVSPTRIVFCSLNRLLKKLGLESKGREKRIVDLRPREAEAPPSEEKRGEGEEKQAGPKDVEEEEGECGKEDG
jgi:phenylacetate-coenzyme A ligase PaaK-like adenylate-forming protein